jgi:beta-glucosidase
MADATSFFADEAGKESGLNLEIFNDPSLTGRSSVKRVVDHVNTDRLLSGGGRQNELSARWTGYFKPSSAGDYLIFVHGPGEEGGSRLYVDDKLVIDNWERVNARVSQVRMPLTATAHKIRLEYFVHDNWGSGVQLGIIRPEEMISAAAKTLASRADAVVIAVGFDSDTESEGGDREFELLPAQNELIQQVATANKNSIVVVTSGGAVNAERWIHRVPAFFETWYPGQEGGIALAQLLFGDYSPSAKLPISWERRWEDSAVHDSYYPKDTGKKIVYSEGVFLGYRHFDKIGIKPLFPFGYGLSYTTFAYKNLSLTPATISGMQTATVSFDIANTGTRAGAEVAEVYVGEANAKVPRPVKELKGFAKVELAPGETKHVSITLDQRAFSYYDVGKHAWTADAGDYKIYVARSAEQVELSGVITRSAP